MKKTSTRKLALGTETLRKLQDGDLRRAAAAFGSTACTNPTLWSDCCKPPTAQCTADCPW